MDDLYDRVRDNTVFRGVKAAEYGVGFELPTLVAPNVPKNKLANVHAFLMPGYSF
jgi:hypothetical protein